MTANPIPPLKPEELVQPLARLLRPLVRLLIHAGITYPALCDLLRTLYVAVAERDFRLAGKSQTDSRISLITGIHRKEVRRLRGTRLEPLASPDSLSLGARIIALWVGAPRFLDETGRPRKLPRTASDPAVPSFDSLVEAITTDMRPRAFLDEWLRQGLVRVADDGHLVLDEAAYLPSAPVERLFYFGRNLHDHVAAATSNVMGGAPLLDRSVHYDGLSEAAARRFEAVAKDAAMQALLQTNAEALKLVESDTPFGITWRANLGVYFYLEPESDAAQASPPDSEKPEDSGE
jgi:hypothetical protein